GVGADFSIHSERFDLDVAKFGMGRHSDVQKRDGKNERSHRYLLSSQKKYDTSTATRMRSRLNPTSVRWYAGNSTPPSIPTALRRKSGVGPTNTARLPRPASTPASRIGVRSSAVASMKNRRSGIPSVRRAGGR